MGIIYNYRKWKHDHPLLESFHIFGMDKASHVEFVAQTDWLVTVNGLYNL